MISDKDISDTRKKLRNAVLLAFDFCQPPQIAIAALDALIAFERVEAIYRDCADVGCTDPHHALEAELARIIAESRSSETPDKQAEVEAQ